MLPIIRSQSLACRTIPMPVRVLSLSRGYATTSGLAQKLKLGGPLAEHKTIISSSIALALAIPAYCFFPVLVNWTLVFAIPPHIAVGIKHVLADYTQVNAKLWAWICAFIVFIGLFQLTRKSVGLGGLLVELFKAEE